MTMKAAQEILDFYAYKTKQAKSAVEKQRVKMLWGSAYDALPETTKTEIKAILKQNAQMLLERQKELDKRIMATGLWSFEEVVSKTIASN